MNGKKRKQQRVERRNMDRKKRERRKNEYCKDVITNKTKIENTTRQEGIKEVKQRNKCLDCALFIYSFVMQGSLLLNYQLYYTQYCNSNGIWN